MAKSIKTPAAPDAEFAAKNTEKALKTFVCMVDGQQVVVEAETALEAQEKAEKEFKKEINIEEPANNNI